MEVRAGTRMAKPVVTGTTDLEAVPVMSGDKPTPGPWPALIGTVACGLLAGLLLTEPGVLLLEQALPGMHKELGELLSNWPMRLTAFGVGLAVIVAFVAVASRTGRATTSDETPETGTATAEVAAPPLPPPPVAQPDWVGEVTPVIGHAAGSLDLFGEEGYSDLLMIDNISPLKVRKLEGIGIGSRADLLRVGRSQLGRQDIARRTGIGVRQLTDWLNKADLLRIDGPPPMTMATIRLLEVAGIETLADLAVARPEAIHRKLVEFGKRQSPDLRLPAVADLAVWVEQANRLGS